MTLQADRYSVTLSYLDMGGDQRPWGTGPARISSSAQSGLLRAPQRSHKPSHLGGWSRGRENGHGAGRGGRGPLPLRGCRLCWRAGARVGESECEAARDAGGLWDTNPSTSLSAGALT
jgi:hypothetical protein